MESNEKNRKSVINRDFGVFVFFLLLSFSFWYLNSLGKETEADIKRPVRFTNIPKGRTFSENNSYRIYLSLKGPGYSILKEKYQIRSTPVTIDLAKVTYKRVPESKTANYYIITSGLAKSFKVQLRSGCDVIAIRPDTLFFSMEKSDPKSENIGK